MTYVPPALFLFEGAVIKRTQLLFLVAHRDRHQTHASQRSNVQVFELIGNKMVYTSTM
jgi:hypothetical protein